MRTPLRIGLVGAGLIGRRHAAAICACEDAALACVVDPEPATREFAATLGAQWFADLDAMLAAGAAEAALLATPNRLHMPGALACIAAGLPLLIEKPLAIDVAEGARIVEAAETAGVPVAVGHHRRHNPLIASAKALIAEGRLGPLTAAHVTVWLCKPDSYFDQPWRRETGGGPVYINLIHELDLLRHLCGPIVEVQAMESNARRGFAVEDTAAVLLRFESGALGTVTLSDAAAAPWSWELTARENPAYPATGESSHLIAGTRGALSLPDLSLWAHPGERSWWAPISATRFPVEAADPLDRQIAQFVAVARREASPLVPAREGLAALAAVEAVKRAAAEGRPVRPDF